MAADDGKITILECIIDDESELLDLECWEKVLKDDGLCLNPMVVRHREIVKMRVRILELVREHRAAFMALVEKARKKS